MAQNQAGIPNAALTKTADDVWVPDNIRGVNLPVSPFDINLNATALSVYGFVGKGLGVLNPRGASNTPTTPESMNDPTGQTVSGPVGHNALGANNPLFWVLVLALIFIGYVGFGFDAKIKRVGGVQGRAGR